MDSCFHIELLGPPLMSWQGRPFTLLRRQARAVLYYLAHDLQPAAREQLLFLLWPDVPQTEARRNLTRLLSYIQKALPHAELVQTRQDTITLSGALVQVDTDQFGQLAGRDEPRALATAVSLYRGDFLSGFFLPQNAQFDAWLAEKQRHYERSCLAALARLVDGETQAGRLEAAIGYAERYLALDDLAEDMHRRLITLYRRTGNRGAALRQFEACAITLERELGVAPLPETRAVYEEARQSLAAPPFWTVPSPRPVWRTLPSLDLPLIGREEAWQALARAYRRLRGGGVILIAGEPGVGKSRLMQEFGVAQDALLLVGNADQPTLPYAPLVEALQPHLSHPALGQGVRPIWLAEAARLLPELKERFPDLPQPLMAELKEGQLRLFEGLTQIVASLARNNRLLLCLDDIHWADEATLGWLGYIGKRLSGSELVILASYRTAEEESLANLRRELERQRLVAEVKLKGLSTAAIAELLRHVDPTLPNCEALARRIRAGTAGNAFFVLEVVRELLETARLAVDLPSLPLPRTVQDAVLRRARRLSPLARQVLDIAAVLSPRLEIETMIDASGRTEMEVVDALQALMSGQLLAAQRGQFVFQHSLARETIYQTIQPWRRRLLHRRAAAALVRQASKGLAGLSGSIARHYAAAVDATKAIHYFHEAALQAQQLFAHEQAVGYLQKAIGLLPQAPGEQPVVAMYEALGRSLHARGRYDGARAAYASAMAALPATAALERARLLQRRAATYTSQHLLDEAEASIAQAVALLDPEHFAGRQRGEPIGLELQLERMSLYYYQQRPPAELDALAAQVKPLVTETGSARHRLMFQQQLVNHRARGERFRLSPVVVGEASAVLRSAIATGAADAIARGYLTYGFTVLWSGRPAEALAPLAAGLAVAEEAGLSGDEVVLRTYLAFAYRLQGDLAQTRLHARSSLQLTAEVTLPGYRAAAEGHLAWLAWREGRRDEVERRAARAAGLWMGATYPFKWAAYWVILVLASERGELEVAFDAAKQMLELNQQRLPDEVEATLLAATSSRASGADTLALVHRAVALACQYGYL